MEALTLFFDRCMGKQLPEALRSVRCPFEVRDRGGEGFRHNMPDDEWLHQVGPKKWLVVSHDAKWQDESPAAAAIKQHKIGCFYLYGANSLAFFKLGGLAHNYNKIVKVVGTEKRPFIYRITSRNSLKKLM